MNQTCIQSSATLAGVAETFVAKKFEKWGWWKRWVAAVFIAGFVGAGCGLAQTHVHNYPSKPDPNALVAETEQQILRLYPVLIAVKQDDPQIWSVWIGKFREAIASAEGNSPSPQDMAKLQTGMRELTQMVWRTVSSADEPTLLTLANQEIHLDEVLQQEAVRECATRGEPGWNITTLPLQSRMAADRMMQLVASAYSQGRGKSVPLPTDEDAARYIQAAATLKSNPMSKEEIDTVAYADKSNVTRFCGSRRHFLTNVVALPNDNVATLRWLYFHSGG